MRNRSVTSRSVGLAATAAVAGLLGAFGVSSADASFSIDVRLDGSAYGAGKSMTVSAGQTLNLAVYAEVNAADATQTGFQEAFLGFQLTPSGAGTGSMLNLATAAPFNGYSSTDQSSTDPAVHYLFQTDTAGNVVYIGGSDTTGVDPTGWFYARSASMQLPAAGTNVSATQQEWKIGTLQLTVAPGTAAGSLSLASLLRPTPTGSKTPSAVWQEVSTAGTSTIDGGTVSAGTPFVVNFATGPVWPPSQAGDVNHDGVVNQLDMNQINFNWLATGPTNDTTFFTKGDLNGDGVINQLDVNIVNFNWLKTYTYEPSVALGAVPEPASLSLIGLGGLAVLARRRRA